MSLTFGFCKKRTENAAEGWLQCQHHFLDPCWGSSGEVISIHLREIFEQGTFNCRKRNPKGTCMMKKGLISNVSTQNSKFNGMQKLRPFAKPCYKTSMESCCLCSPELRSHGVFVFRCLQRGKVNVLAEKKDDETLAAPRKRGSCRCSRHMQMPLLQCGLSDHQLILPP